MRRYYRSSTPTMVRQQCICCMNLYPQSEINADGHCRVCHAAETIIEGLPKGTAIKVLAGQFIPLYTACGQLRSYGSPDWNNCIIAARYQTIEQARERILR